MNRTVKQIGVLMLLRHFLLLVVRRQIAKPEKTPLLTGASGKEGKNFKLLKISEG